MSSIEKNNENYAITDKGELTYSGFPWDCETSDIVREIKKRNEPGRACDNRIMNVVKVLFEDAAAGRVVDDKVFTKDKALQMSSSVLALYQLYKHANI